MGEPDRVYHPSLALMMSRGAKVLMALPRALQLITSRVPALPNGTNRVLHLLMSNDLRVDFVPLDLVTDIHFT